MHIHINAMVAIVYLLMAIVTTNSINVWSKMHPNNHVARAWALIWD